MRLHHSKFCVLHNGGGSGGGGGGGGGGIGAGGDRGISWDYPLLY